MDQNQYINMNSGLNLNPDLTEPDNENGVYFLGIYLQLKKAQGILTEEDIQIFNQVVENITAYDGNNRVPGLYDRVAGDSLDADKNHVNKISHDNITSISAFSRLFKDKMSFHKDIAKYGLKNQMRYDNGYPDKARWVYKQDSGQVSTSFQWHPRDWYYWLTNGGYWFAWVFFPIFFFANIITCYTPKEETSGKLLMFTRLEAGSQWSKLMWLNKKLCYMLLRRKYGVNWIDSVCSIYFHQNSNSPIREVARNLEL